MKKINRGKNPEGKRESGKRGVEGTAAKEELSGGKVGSGGEVGSGGGQRRDLSEVKLSGLLLIIAASTVSPVSASTMWAYERGCGGKFISWRCGCRNLAGYKGGYVFNYSGGWIGRFYYGSGCGGRYDAVAHIPC